MAVYTDDFTGNDGDDLAGRTASGGGIWAQAGGTASGAEINASDQLRGNDTSAAGSGFTLGDTGGADHYAQGTIKDASHTGFPLVVGLLDNGNFSAALRLAPNIQVWQRNANVLTQLGGNVGIGTFNAADSWKIARTGTTITVSRNGTSVMTRTAAVHLTETKAGIVVRGGVEDPLLDDFECGSIGAADITVSPAPGAVEVSGLLPTVSLVAATLTVSPAPGAVEVSGLLPTVSLGTAPITVSPAPGVVTVSGLTPIVALVSATITVSPAPGVVTVAGRTPIVTVGTTSEIPVRSAILAAVTAALQAASITVRGNAVTVEAARTDAIALDQRPRLVVIGGDQESLPSDTLEQRYRLRIILAGYVAASTPADAEEDAATLHAYAVRALIRPDPDALPVALTLADGTEVWLEEIGMRVEPATVAQSEAPMADLVADFSADVTRPWGSPFVTT